MACYMYVLIKLLKECVFIYVFIAIPDTISIEYVGGKENNVL
jgi:hypothetical protein